MTQKMMTKVTFQILKTLVAVDLVIAIVSVLFFDSKTLWNTQIGFVSASLVMLASMKSYQRMVNARVEHNIITADDSKDVIDRLEDPYDLYSEETEVDTEKDLSQTVKEEKRRLKENKRTLGQTLKDTKAALSLYRLGAYVVLILGFLYLNRHGLLQIPSYIVSLGLPMVIIVSMLLRNKSEEIHV